MTRKKGISYSEVKIFEILKEYKSGVNVLEICRRHGVSKSAIYKWNNIVSGYGVI